MNLQEFTDGTPLTKPWLTIVSNSETTNDLSVSGDSTVHRQLVTIARSNISPAFYTGSPLVPLTHVFGGIFVVDTQAVATITMPTDAQITAAYGTITESINIISFTIINRNFTNPVTLNLPSGVAGIKIPKPAATGQGSVVTQIYLLLIFGVWSYINGN